MRWSEKKIIAIVTFCNTLDNYGQVLQYLATQVFLDARGHESFLFVPQGHKLTVWNRLIRKIKKTARKVLKNFSTNQSKVLREPTSSPTLDEQKQVVFQQWAEVTERNEQHHPRHFADFRQKFFHLRACCYEEVGDVYAYAIGSDQMWSFVSENSMLSFVRGNAKRFSIAPSVGHKVFSEEEIKAAAPALAKFDFVTVRERNGLEFCNACGRKDAQLVLDPTLLISASAYDEYADLQGLQLPRRYILLYLLGGEIEPNIQNIYDWAAERQLEVVYVASQGRDDEFPKCYATVEQWLAILKNAEFVFTNSYHGMALSIIYQKRFLVFPLVGLMKGMNGRIFQLADDFYLQERIYAGDMDFVEHGVDWKRSNEAIAKNRHVMDGLLKTIGL